MTKLSYEMQINMENLKKLVEANHALLEFIKSKYPDDFKEGGPGFSCPHHREIDDILKNIRNLD